MLKSATQSVRGECYPWPSLSLSLSLSPENSDLHLSYFAEFVCCEVLDNNSVLKSLSLCNKVFSVSVSLSLYVFLPLCLLVCLSDIYIWVNDDSRRTCRKGIRKTPSISACIKCQHTVVQYIISLPLSPHLRTPFPPFSPSLISLMVSVDVKHHVYFLTYNVGL